MQRMALQFLNDIEVSLDHIVKYTRGISKEAFHADSIIHDAVAWNFEVMGEAEKNLPDDLKARHPTVDWRKLGGLRDAIGHGNFRIDYDVLWGIIEDDVPHFHSKIRDIIIEEELREAGRKR